MQKRGIRINLANPVHCALAGLFHTWRRHKPCPEPVLISRTRMAHFCPETKIIFLPSTTKRYPPSHLAKEWDVQEYLQRLAVSGQHDKLSLAPFNIIKNDMTSTFMYRSTNSTG